MLKSGGGSTNAVGEGAHSTNSTINRSLRKLPNLIRICAKLGKPLEIDRDIDRDPTGFQPPKQCAPLSFDNRGKGLVGPEFLIEDVARENLDDRMVTFDLCSLGDASFPNRVARQINSVSTV